MDHSTAVNILLPKAQVKAQVKAAVLLHNHTVILLSIQPSQSHNSTKVVVTALIQIHHLAALI
jgi:hypothetical protein